MSFRKGDLPKRLAASAVSARRQSLESIGAVLVMGIVLWAICIGAAFVIYWGKDGDDSKSDPVLSVEYVLFLAGYVDAGVAGRSTGKKQYRFKRSCQSGFSWHVLFVWDLRTDRASGIGRAEDRTISSGLLVHKGK